ncbi:MAG: hypothetical protein QNJ13_09065 [Paracoccaceae bacterium]|nr:hypothetical protein [Paracoccaceae bacterium]
MKIALHYLKRACASYARRTEGGLSVEAILMFPMLAWAYMGMYFFFDAYRQQNINLKAAYTVSDMLSREVDVIYWKDIEGLNRVLDFLTASANPTQIRVSVVYFDADTDRHMLVWSRGTRGKLDLTQNQINDSYSDQIPIMADSDTAILVETWAYYEPTVNIGLSDVTFDNMIVTSPRFAPQLCYEVCGELGSGSAHDDNTDDGANEEPTST